MSLQYLIAEAVALGGGNLCASGVRNDANAFIRQHAEQRLRAIDAALAKAYGDSNG